MILVRHAESEWNRHFSATRIDPGIPDPLLTERGRAQTLSLVEEIGRLGTRRLIASPYKRTLETARAIAGPLGLDIAIEPLVRERCFFSCDIGSHPEHLAELFPEVDFTDLAADWWGEPPESEAALQVRCDAFRAKLVDLADLEDVAVISHWGFIRAFTGQAVENATVLRCEPEMLRPEPEA
jgi:broad specificity phosphatase PhoE